MKNEMHIQFSALSQNESFARVAVAAFVAQLDPDMEELTEIKTVVSEAVTNSIIHGYNEQPDGIVYISAYIENQTLELEIRDNGIGIEDLDEARQPLFTSKPDLERSGMGFTIMENFMNEFEVTSSNAGTTVRMKKYLSNSSAICN